MRLGKVAAGADPRRHDPALAEAPVDGPIRIEAGEHELAPKSRVGIARRHDHAIRLDPQGEGGEASRLRHLAAIAETGVERAIDVVPREQDALATQKLVTPGNELAVGLDE